MFWRLLDRFDDTMEAIFFVVYLGLMLVIGWNFFDDDRVLFILIVLYVVVVGGFYALLRHRQQTVLLHPAIRAILFLHWLVFAAPLRLARGMARRQHRLNRQLRRGFARHHSSTTTTTGMKTG